jgi:kumamolisin
VNGGVATESGWASSGGGISIFFDRPAWQTGNGVPAGKKRLFPDISLAADPNEGANAQSSNVSKAASKPKEKDRRG